jgi:ABC-type nitrate/sulfonate/bicarbonate transport system substrate-binding protein
MRLIYGIPTDKEAVQIRLGVSKGFFEEEGINLELKVIFGGPEIARAYDDGSIVIGEIGSPPAIVALQKKYRFKIVASSIRQRALQYFVTNPGINSWDQLRGKTMATLSIGSCSYWFMRQVLLSRGLNPDRDVKIIGLGKDYPKVVNMFLSKKITGAILSEPNVSIGEAAGAFVIKEKLASAEFSPLMQWSIIVANNKFSSSSPDVVLAILRGIFRSYQYCINNPEEFVEYSADYLGVCRHAISNAVEREKSGLCSNGILSKAALQEAINLQYRLGAIKYKPKIDELVDFSYLETLYRPNDAKGKLTL